jgi:hypothetical protein
LGEAPFTGRCASPLLEPTTALFKVQFPAGGWQQNNCLQQVLEAIILLPFLTGILDSRQVQVVVIRGTPFLV